jgi:formate hydrogenlyase subunit 3/multisubunit Na+/H+ antiporter MnhD subunit
MEMTVIGLPILLISSLLLMAALTYLVRGWDRIVALIAAGYTGVIALLLWVTDLSQPMMKMPLINVSIDFGASLERLGFVLQLQTSSIPVLAMAFALTSVAFLLSARVSQGHSFIPLALGLLVGYTVMILTVAGPIAPALLAPLFLVALSCVSAFILQAGRLTHPAGSLRVLIPPTLAFPAFLLAAWYISQVPFNPQDNTALFAAAQMISLGLLLLAAPVPLHSAQPASMQSAPPVVSALVTLLYQLAVLHLFFWITTGAYDFVLDSSSLVAWFGVAGLITAVWGGIAAVGINNAGRLLGYTALHDWGLILLVLAIPEVRTLPLVLFMFSVRAISMMTAAAGLSMLEQHAGGLDPRSLQGAGSRLPWNSAALLLGGLGLAGFPLTAGFTSHWSAIQTVAGIDWRPAVIVLIASGGAVFGFIRLARVLFGPLKNRAMLRERSMGTVVAIAAILVSVSLAVAPQLLNELVSRALLAFVG